jgi:hypothetical protein
MSAMGAFIKNVDSKSSKNRIFWDGLIRLVWTEVAIPFEHRSAKKDEWMDIELPSYVSWMQAEGFRKKGVYVEQINRNTGCRYVVPRDVLTKKEKNHLQAFIDRHYTESVTEFRTLANDEDVFNTCHTSCMSEIHHIPYGSWH